MPAEHLVEKQLKIKQKNDIEKEVGIEKFNQTCHNTVCEMSDSWEDVIEKIGRWVDYHNAYRTMDSDYIESVWWAFKELYNKGLVYEDVRISLYCPRCETPLANFEIAMDNSYQDVTDPSVFVKFKLTSGPYKGDSLLVWTTTPWTLPANTALAVGEDLVYSRIKTGKRETIIIAQERLEELPGEHAVMEELKGKDLEGASYAPPFNEFHHKGGEEKNLHKVFTADFVTTEEGSGIVHMAPAFGEDDFKLSKERDIPIIENLDSQSRFVEGPWKGKKAWEANQEIIDDLKEKKILFLEREITHSYPFCHRCKEKLIYKTQPAWFLNVQKIKEKMIERNEEINWQPEHLKHGRFLKGLESAPDWTISRDRYWASPMPVWRCDKCKKLKVIGSFEELYQLSGQKLKDYHRPYIDRVDFKCECDGTYKRIPQVLDCWFESGAMPFAERHYPFENQDDFTKKFPADYISEYLGQTRAWFYVLHVLAVALFDKPAFKNVVTTGVIGGEDGRKMSKSLGNYTDPKEVLEQYGGDALRFYLMSSPIMEGKNINFTVKDVAEVKRGVMATFWNSYSFFVTYALVDKYDHTEPKKILEENPTNVLDRWILSELNLLIRDFEASMENYQITKAARLIPEFAHKLSNWYIRRSRRRFWKAKNDKNKKAAYDTLYEVLVKLSQVMAPFMPFVSEVVYQNLTREESVHLTNYPACDKRMIDESLMKNMNQVRDVVKEALALRAKAQIKVRQPLARLYLNQKEIVEDEDLKKIIAEEINVKNVTFAETEDLKKKEEPEELVLKEEGDLCLALDPKLTEKLEQEGQAREIIRNVQEMRRKAGFQVDDRIILAYEGAETVFNNFGYLITRETLTKDLHIGKMADAELSKDAKINGEKIYLAVKKAG